MLTPAPHPVDGLRLFLSVSELAAAKGVSKQAISKRVDRLAREGLLTKRPGERGQVMISLAEYDRAVGDTTDLGRTLGNATRDSDAAPLPDVTETTYTAEQTRAKRLEADLKQLDLDERLGKLIPVDELAEAGRSIGEALLRAIEQLPARAADLAAAVAKDGEAGARGILRQTAFELRDTLARALTDGLPPVSNG